MKKAGLFAALLTCFTLAFSAPTADAKSMQSNGVDMSATTRTNDNSTLGEDMRQGYQGMKNGMSRATNRVEYDVNRTMNSVGNGVNGTMNRATNGMGNGVRAYDTGMGNGLTNNRYNNMNNAGNGYRAAATTTDNNRGWSWGWLGLIGLFGLAGMRSRDRDRA